MHAWVQFNLFIVTEFFITEFHFTSFGRCVLDLTCDNFLHTLFERSLKAISHLLIVLILKNIIFSYFSSNEAKVLSMPAAKENDDE